MSSGGKEWKPTKEFVVDGDADLKAFNDFLFKRVCVLLVDKCKFVDMP